MPSAEVDDWTHYLNRVGKRYCEKIKSEIYSGYPGYREDAELLSEILEDLESKGLHELVQSFIKQMSNPVKLDGFMLEIMIADTFCIAPFNGVVTCNRREGISETPCDVTYEEDGLRIDAQCKTLQNITNERFTDDFINWVENKYSTYCPGAWLTIQAESAAKEEDFKELKRCFQNLIAKLTLHGYINFASKSGRRIHILITPKDDAGITFRGRWLGFGSTVDWDDLRQRICNRMNEARRTYSSPPSNEHLNLLIIQLPELSFRKEEDIYCALYGKSFTKVSQNSYQEGRDNSGAFFTCQSSAISAVVVKGSSSWLRKYDWAVYPHPEHYEVVKRNLIERSRQFRFGNVH